MTKVPGGTVPPKSEPLMTDGSGVGPEIGEVQPILFAEDHQLPVPDQTYPPGEDPDSIRAYKQAGWDVEVQGGGLTGHLKK